MIFFFPLPHWRTEFTFINDHNIFFFTDSVSRWFDQSWSFFFFSFPFLFPPPLIPHLLLQHLVFSILLKIENVDCSKKKLGGRHRLWYHSSRCLVHLILLIQVSSSFPCWKTSLCWYFDILLFLFCFCFMSSAAKLNVGISMEPDILFNYQVNSLYH